MSRQRKAEAHAETRRRGEKEDGHSCPPNGGLEKPPSVGDAVQTELGRLPADWRVDRFDSIFDVQQGRQVSKDNRVGNNQRPFLRTKNVFWNRLDLADLDEMHFSEADESRLALKPDDLLICEGGDIGRTAIWNGAISRCYYQNHLHRARIRDLNAADARFVLFWLWYAFEFGNLYFGRGNVTTIPNLSQSKLRELPVVIPTLPEQRKIAGVLGVVQRAMEQQERLIALTTELKKVLLHQFFTQGLRSEPQKQTEIGPVPESWEVVKLEHLLAGELQNGAFVRRHQFGSGMAFANVVDMYRDTYVDLEKVERVQVDAEEFAKYSLRKGDVLVVRSSLKREGIGQNSVVGVLSEPAIFDCHLIRVVPVKHKLISEFLSFYWRSPVGKLDLIQRSKTVTMTTINQAGLSTALVPVAPMDEQREIVDVLLAVEAKARLHTRKYAAFNDIFHTLLHQLMTAQIRVDDLNLEALNVSI